MVDSAAMIADHNVPIVEPASLVRMPLTKEARTESRCFDDYRNG